MLECHCLTFCCVLQPHMVAWYWRPRTGLKNDFFMFAASHSIAVGGGGHFALWLDSDFMHGNSGFCDTFGNPSLSSTQDFIISKVELWSLA